MNTSFSNWFWGHVGSEGEALFLITEQEAGLLEVQRNKSISVISPEYSVKNEDCSFRSINVYLINQL